MRMFALPAARQRTHASLHEIHLLDALRHGGRSLMSRISSMKGFPGHFYDEIADIALLASTGRVAAVAGDLRAYPIELPSNVEPIENCGRIIIQDIGQ
jgi:hypothetical protein